MRTHTDIVKDAGKAAEVALACGVSIYAVRAWIQRNGIPAHHWATFINRGFAGLDELSAVRGRAA
jgi:hypothetical protein